MVGRHAIPTGVRQKSVPVLRRTRVQSRLQRIRGQEEGSDRPVQHAGARDSSRVSVNNPYERASRVVSQMVVNDDAQHL